MNKAIDFANAGDEDISKDGSDEIKVVNNNIYFYGSINKKTILELNKSLREVCDKLLGEHICRNSSQPSPIFLHINSYGGFMFDGIAGMDQILKLKSTIEIITIVEGGCASAATFLSIVGSKRLITSHSFMLIHQVSSGFWGKYEEFKDEMQNLDKVMKLIKNIYRQYTKLPMKELNNILKRDIWLNAEECLKYGLIDKIVG
ncbi:MAG: hypothetical protein A2V66_03585 [Ignavibacteria bacterium RBG_13_36_8]|nr:MAG: hypothetical protein A2V66_03585 [Ignavibacteria bacterium RBG_13_36_8]